MIPFLYYVFVTTIYVFSMTITIRCHLLLQALYEFRSKLLPLCGTPLFKEIAIQS